MAAENMFFGVVHFFWEEGYVLVLEKGKGRREIIRFPGFRSFQEGGGLGFFGGFWFLWVLGFGFVCLFFVCLRV